MCQHCQLNHSEELQSIVFGFQKNRGCQLVRYLILFLVPLLFDFLEQAQVDCLFLQSQFCFQRFAQSKVHRLGHSKYRHHKGKLPYMKANILLQTGRKLIEF